MPYLQVELDALDLFEDVALAAGISAGDVYRGMLRLWRRGLREKTADVTAERLATFFPCPLARIVPSLIACEFLAHLEGPNPGGYLVRGAKKRLGILDAKARGGKARASTASRNQQGQLIAQHVLAEPPACAGQLDQESTSTNPALSPNTKHQTPKKEKQLPVDNSPSLPTVDSAREVFEHWRKVMGKTGSARFNAKRRGAVSARLREGYSHQQLMCAIDGCALTAHNMGQNERGERYDDLELICRNGSQVERFIRNAEHPPLPQRDGPGVRETSDEEFRRQTAGLKRTADGLFILEE